MPNAKREFRSRTAGRRTIHQLPSDLGRVPNLFQKASMFLDARNAKGVAFSAHGIDQVIVRNGRL
jgi:hypothetical protein